MTRPSAILFVIVFASTAVAAAVSLHYMDHLPAMLITAPGYILQSELFVRHRALGGLGYQLTMIGASALFWTLFLLTGLRVVRFVIRRLFRGRKIGARS